MPPKQPRSSPKKRSIWLIDLTEKPLGRSFQPRLLVKTSQDLSVEQIEAEWSPDSRQILLTINSKDKKVSNIFFSK